jgi:competence protein ComEC
MHSGTLRRAAALFCIIVCTLCPLFGAPEQNAQLRITVHAAGHGDMIEIRTPGGATSLIDCGSAASPRARQAVGALPPKLRYFIASHPHEDHIGNNALVAARADIIVDSGLESADHIQSELYAQAAHGKQFIFAEEGITLDLGDGVYIEILAPQRRLIRGTRADPNNNSIVMMLGYGSFRMLFTGDIETEAIDALLARKPDLGCDIVKVPHHGSRGSLNPRFIKALGAKYAVISAAPDGAREGHGLPHEDVIRAYRDLRAEVFITGRHGTIEITSNGEEYEITAVQRDCN